MNARGHILVRRSKGWSDNAGGRKMELGDILVELDWSTFVNIVLSAARNVPKSVRNRPHAVAE
jgi:hypothetical protein